MNTALKTLLIGVGLSMAASTAAVASVHTLDCTVTLKEHQTTDYKKNLRPYRLVYTITNRGWKTTPITGWYNDGVFLQRFDSITGTTESYTIPNNSGHFVKSGQTFAWSKDFKRGYVSEDGSRQFTFVYSKGGIEVSDRDNSINKTFLGTCTRVKNQAQQ